MDGLQADQEGEVIALVLRYDWTFYQITTKKLDSNYNYCKTAGPLTLIKYESYNDLCIVS